MDAEIGVSDGGPLSLPRGYRVTEILSQTNTSDVYLAEVAGRNVVLKVLRHNVDDAGRRLFEEGNALTAGVVHPCLIAVSDMGRLRDGRPWVAMEHHRRGSLGDGLRRSGALPLQGVLAVGVRLAEVLHLLHRDCRVLHRDVKPDNVLIDDDGEIVLTDLGVVGLMHAHTASVTTDRLTAFYAAPEVRDHGRFTVASEIFSLGVTLVELLTAEQPFAPRPGESREAHLARWDAAAPPDQLGRPVPAPVAALLRSMISGSSRDRPPSMAVVATRMRALQSGLGLPATPPTPPLLARSRPVSGSAGHTSAPLPRRSRRRRTSLVAATALLLAAGGVAATLPTWTATTAPRVVDVAEFRPFSSDGTFFPTTVAPDGRLVLPAPPDDYEALRGVTLPVEVCEGRVELSLHIRAPATPSIGYGVGIAPRGALAGGTPVGTSMQLEWNGDIFASRVVTLPDQSVSTTASYESRIRPGTWHRIVLVMHGEETSVLLDGLPVGGSPLLGERPCGELLVRAWGTTVTLGDVTLTSE